MPTTSATRLARSLDTRLSWMMTFDLTIMDCTCETSKRMAFTRNCCSTVMSELKKSRGWEKTSANVDEVARTRFGFPIMVRPGVVKKPLPTVWLACLGLALLSVLGE